MGISGLLPLLKEAQEPVHISKYKGKVLGVDAYVWLHRGAYGCAEALALGRPTQGYVNYAMTRVRLLQHYGVIPYVVFDGGHLPAKAKTEEGRGQRRKESLEKAMQLLAKGRKREAHEYFVRCIDVTPEMAYQLIKALRKESIQYIVAAYEADAQLAYLERHNIIHGIITEDSDLLVFGCRTVIYKMDNEGNCMEFDYNRRSCCSSLNLKTMNDATFRQMAILSGCDYLASIPGLGLKKSYSLLQRFQTVARVLAFVRMDGMRVPEGYQEAFERAERTFVYQRVFHRESADDVRIVTLTPPSNQDLCQDDDCIGSPMSHDMARLVSIGELNPITKAPIVDISPLQNPSERQSPFVRQKAMKVNSLPNSSKQRKIHGFFPRAQSDQCRSPLQTKNNIEAIGTLHPPATGKTASPPRTTISPYVECNSISQLATFTPVKERKRCASPSSSDGLISSPTSASTKRQHYDLSMSPPENDENTSSPYTSPTLETRSFASAGPRRGENLFDKFRYEAPASAMRSRVKKNMLVIDTNHDDSGSGPRRSPLERRLEFT